MKRFRIILFASSSLALALGGVAGVSAREAPSAVVELEKGDRGSRCAIVFGRVGERLHCDLDGSAQQSPSNCEVGEDAQGRASALPRGLVFDEERAVLSGVPLQSGFHEFVVRRNENGVLREQVLLIDIQGTAHAGNGVDYASYFSSGIR